MNSASALTENDKKTLLTLARHCIEVALNEETSLELRLEDYPAILQQEGASFVTLTIAGQLRGCIGALEPYQPLVQDVCEHAVAAALEDYRFPLLTAAELTQVSIEISRLTVPVPLTYQTPAELLRTLRPHIDGVIIRDGARRATFLPQVWDKLPNPADFLSHLCQKMGARPNLWQKKPLAVFIYQVEEFRESAAPPD